MSEPIPPGNSEPAPPIKVAILSRNRTLYSTSRLVEAAEQRGHEVRVIEYLKCHMNIASHQSSIFLGEEELTGFNTVIPRSGATHPFFGTAVVRQFEMMGVYPVNESAAISPSRDKLRNLQLLARKGVGLLRSNHGPVIMEVNTPPGLEGIETVTGKDVAGTIIDFISRNAKAGKTGTRGRG